MSTPSTLFNNLFADEAHIAFDRAAAELRNARPIVIETDSGLTLVAALDGVAPHLYSIFQNLIGSRLVVSTKRAKALGIEAQHPVAFPLNRDDRYRIFEYACHEGNHALENMLRLEDTP